MLSFSERRRLAVALIITLIAVPALLLSRGDSSKGSDNAPVTSLANSYSTDDSKPLDPAFLPEVGATTTIGPITVNVPPTPTGTHVKGEASFIRWPSELTRDKTICATPHAKIGTEITVTNLDNGRSLTCMNATTESRGDLVIIIDADRFIEIADLVDAPIPVEIVF